jgi:hypothetical protein
MSELKSQLKRRLLDLGFLALAGLVGVGAFYGYVMIRNHILLDQALLQVIQDSRPASSEAPAEEPAEAPAEVPE